jgi:hypothetical protein
MLTASATAYLDPVRMSAVTAEIRRRIGLATLLVKAVGKRAA